MCHVKNYSELNLPLLEVSCNEKFQMKQLYLTFWYHVVCVKIFHQTRQNPTDGKTTHKLLMKNNEWDIVLKTGKA